MAALSSRSLIACLLFTVAACDRHSPAPEQANAGVAVTPDEAPAQPAAPAVAVGAIDRSHHGEAAPAVSFTGPDGKPTSLAAFRGKPVLLNLWATWCTPCVGEMPTLDRLAQEKAGTLLVLPVSQDLDGAAKVTPFFAQHEFKALRPYLDPKLGLSLAYKANLPTSILYDAAGREVWRTTGGLDWTGAKAAQALAEAG